MRTKISILKDSKTERCVIVVHGHLKYWSNNQKKRKIFNSPREAISVFKQNTTEKFKYNIIKVPLFR